MTKAPEIEAALLGRAILEPNYTIPEIIDILEPKHFYTDFNQVTFAALKFMYGRHTIDPNTLAYQLAKRHEKKPIPLPPNPNFHYLVSTLTINVTGTENIVQYAAIIHQCYANRKLQSLTANLQDATYLEENWDELKAEIDSLQPPEPGKKDWYSLEDALIQLNELVDKKKTQQKILTGFSCMDNKIGFNPGDSIVIGARPGVGKSAFMGQLAINIAKNNTPVGIISLEMSNEQIAARVASITTEIPFRSIWQGLFADEQETIQYYGKLQGLVGKLPIYVTDQVNLNMQKIKIKAAKLAKIGAKVVFIDYLQLVSVDEKKNSVREQQIAAISRNCKLMAKELDMVVILLAQLNRTSTQRTGAGRYPQATDLRESGAIEQDADILLFLHRDYAIGNLTDEHGNNTADQADLICRKWRNEPPFHEKLKFDGPTMQFVEQGAADYNKSVDNDNPFGVSKPPTYKPGEDDVLF
jgi:replicative DNA helicase